MERIQEKEKVETKQNDKIDVMNGDNKLNFNLPYAPYDLENIFGFSKHNLKNIFVYVPRINCFQKIFLIIFLVFFLQEIFLQSIEFL